MTIFINGEARELESGFTIAAMLDTLELPTQRVAIVIETNRRVIRKQEWESTKVADNDRIEVVHFVGGG